MGPPEVAPKPRIPLWVERAYTFFMGVLVTFYWSTYGPSNFLYFCDVALFLTLAAIWFDHPLPAGMALVGIFVPQMLWVVDFLAGANVIGLTKYMFDENIPLFARCLSSFHGWLPFFLLWIVWRLGYDRRSFAAWTVLAWVLIIICYLFMPPPPKPTTSNAPVNINYVYGLSDQQPQDWMDPNLYVFTLMIFMPAALFLPMHLALCKFAPRANANPTAQVAAP